MRIKITMGFAVMANLGILSAFTVKAQTIDTTKVNQLEEVEVKSKYYKQYNLKKLSGAIRLGDDLIKISQNIQIIDNDILLDQAVYNLNESVTRNVSGTFREELHNGISPDIYSRGGYITALRNGVDLRPLGKGPIADDVSIIESVEFLKGPSNYLNAVSDPSGSYNINTKKPNGNSRTDVNALLGSFNFLRAAIDQEGKLDEKNRLQYRINLMGMRSNGFLDYDYNARFLIAPSVKYIIDSKSALTLEYIYQNLNYKNLSDAQMSPTGYGTLPVNFTITDPFVKPFVGTDHNLFLTYENKIHENWDFTAKASYINSGYDGSMFWVYGARENNTDILDRYFVLDRNQYNVSSVQSYISGQFNIGASKHQLISGLDFNHKNSHSWDTWNTATTIYPLSISNPVYSNVVPNNGIGGSFESENDISAPENKIHRKLYYVSAFAMDEISFLNDKLKFTLGLRATHATGDANDYGTVSASKDLVLTPRLGLNYAILDDFTTYALFDQTFLPTTGIASDGNLLKPLRGSNYEIGFKKDWADKAWNTTISLYSVTRNRLLTPDPTSGLNYQTGESISKGVEFDLRGRLAKGLNVILNYAYTDSKITKDDYQPQMIGLPTPNRVKHIQNTWLNYQLPIKAIEGFQISAGYQLLAGRAERFTTINPNKLNDLFRLDSGLGWSNEKLQINFLVNNILNAKMYTTAWQNGGGDMYYWVQSAPINGRLSLSIKL